MKNVFLAMMVLAAVACDKPSSDGTKDRARQEQEAAREVENKANADKAKVMEAQLTELHHYYTALEGEYQGNFSINGRAYEVAFTFARNIPEFDGSRVRQLSEIEADINNLRLRAKAMQWLSSDPMTSVTCLNPEVKITNFTSGVLRMDMTCPASTNSYVVYLAEPNATAPTTATDLANAETAASQVASKVNSKAVSKVETIVGQILFANNPKNGRGFSASRK